MGKGKFLPLLAIRHRPLNAPLVELVSHGQWHPQYHPERGRCVAQIVPMKDLDLLRWLLLLQGVRNPRSKLECISQKSLRRVPQIIVCS